MIAELTWHPQAREDLLDIYVTIGFDNPDAARRFYATIETRAATLVHHPRLGPRRPDIRPSVRILVEGPYLILFETHPDTDEGSIDEVVIVRVVDGRRDLTKLF
jgi:toxin ParE1/3/4